MNALWSDVRFALRSLARARGYTAIVALTLGLGIGATSGVFSAVRATLLASLPYPEPDRLVMGRRLQNGERWRLVSVVDYFDFREQATGFASLAALWAGGPNRSPLIGGGAPEWVGAFQVSDNLFSTLGVVPALGRLFTADEGRQAEAPAPGEAEARRAPAPAILSHGFWQRRFGGVPEVLGRTLTLGSQQVTVVGVLPAGFFFLADADVFTVLRPRPGLDQRRYHNLVLVGRLKPGVTEGRAQAEIDAISRRLERQHPESNRGKGLYLTPLREAQVEGLRPAMLLVLGTVVLMLLIACANAANLGLARGVTRRSQFAIRSAVGASRGQLVRGLLVESLAVSMLGGIVGVAFASALQRLLPSLLDLGRLGVRELRLDLPLVAFAACVSLVCGIAVGIAPALRSTEGRLGEELAGGSRGGSPKAGMRLRLVLVGVQAALSTVLLLGSILLARSVGRLLNEDLGFAPDRLMIGRVVPAERHVTDEGRRALYTELLAEIRAIPGVQSAAMITQLPIVQPGGSIRVWTPGQERTESEGWVVNWRRVLPGYPKTLGMAQLAGRDVTDGDRTGAPPVLVISRRMATVVFRTVNPIGRQLVVDIPAQPAPVTFEIVGVVGDATDRIGSPPPPTMYLSYAQFPDQTMSVAIRTAADPAAITAVLRETVSRRDRDMPVLQLTTMSREIRSITRAQTTLAGTVGAFSLVALLLAGLGLFGILAYQVNQRAHELGVRMALGAGTGRVLAAVARQGMAATAAGLVVGAAASLALGRYITSLLYEVRPTDPVSLAAAAAGLVAVALLACVVPARRALAIEPVRVLRYE